MRTELTNELMMILTSEGIENPIIKSKFIMCLDKYEVQKRTTEIAIVEEDAIDKYIQLFLLNKRVAGRTERTIKQYKSELGRFFEKTPKDPREITANDIKFYLATKEVQDNASKVYQKNMIRVISSFYTWMMREEYILKNPMNKVDEIKIPKIKKKAFTDIEIEKIRNHPMHIREKALIEVLLSTWCRIDEIENMNISHIKQDYSMEVIGKGQKLRTVYLNAKAQVALDEYIKSRTDDNDALFVSKDEPHERLLKSQMEKMLRDMGKELEIKKVHPHRFRRTGATMALRKGMPIEQVSKLLGHESIETTQVYLDLSEEDARISHKKYVN